jgi:hypothetical protein
MKILRNTETNDRVIVNTLIDLLTYLTDTDTNINDLELLFTDGYTSFNVEN